MIMDIQKSTRISRKNSRKSCSAPAGLPGYSPTSGCMPDAGQLPGDVRRYRGGVPPAAAHLPDQRRGAGDCRRRSDEPGHQLYHGTRDTNIIAQVLAGESTVSAAFSAEQLAKIAEFGQHMDFFGIDLTQVPQWSFRAENLPLLIFPILAIVTMFISHPHQNEGLRPEMQGGMKIMMYIMPLTYLFFCFTVPAHSPCTT